MGKNYESKKKRVSENKEGMEKNENDQRMLWEEYSILSSWEKLMSELEDEVFEAVGQVEKEGENEEKRLKEEKEVLRHEREELVEDIESELEKLQSGLKKLEQLDWFKFGSERNNDAKAEYQNFLGKYTELLKELEEDGNIFGQGEAGITAPKERMGERENLSDGFQEQFQEQDYNMELEKSTSDISREIIETLIQKEILNTEERDLIRKAIMSGMIGEKEIRARGIRVRERYDELIIERNREFDSLQEKRRELALSRVANPNNADLERINAEREELINREKEYQRKYSRQDMIKNLLKEYRTIGPSESDPGQEYEKGWFNSSANVIHAIDSVRPYIPTEWVEKSNSVPIKTRYVSRGYFNMDGGKPTIALSNAGSGMQRCAFHEMGHFYEELYPEIRKLEHEFYNRRTEGEELQWLGRGYKKDEVTRFDHFISPYMGKDYGNTETSGYELFSMGMEAVFAGEYNLERDPEYHDFILGILTSI